MASAASSETISTMAPTSVMSCGGNREGWSGEEVAEPFSLVGNHRDQVAALTLQVEAHRQILDVSVDGFPEVGDDVFAQHR